MESLDLSNTPSLMPPAGVTSNFTNPYSLSTLINASAGICLAVSSLCLFVRMYVRLFLMKKHGLEDYSIVLAWLGFIGYTALGLTGVHYGSGTHQWDVPLDKFISFLQLANILEVYYNPLIFLTKFSILLQYVHIFCPQKRGGTYWTIVALIVFNFLFYLAVMIVQILACIPRQKIWTPSLPGTCVDLAKVLLTGGVINVISDVSMLILPIYKVWKLRMTTIKKVGVTAAFSTGVFACVSSILRLVNNVEFNDAQDVTYVLTPIALWTFGEIASGIMCACLPVFPRLFKQLAPRLRSTRGDSSGNRTSRTDGPQQSKSREEKFYELRETERGSEYDPINDANK